MILVLLEDNDGAVVLARRSKRSDREDTFPDLESARAAARQALEGMRPGALWASLFELRHVETLRPMPSERYDDTRGPSGLVGGKYLASICQMERGSMSGSIFTLPPVRAGWATPLRCLKHGARMADGSISTRAKKPRFTAITLHTGGPFESRTARLRSNCQRKWRSLHEGTVDVPPATLCSLAHEHPLKVLYPHTEESIHRKANQIGLRRRRTPLPRHRVLLQLREARESARITRKELAKIMGYHVVMIGRWERGDQFPNLIQAPCLGRCAIHER